MKNILLVDISSRNLIVTSYLVTKERHGQLILRYVGELGRLETFKVLDSKEAYVAVKADGYQSKIGSNFTTEFSSVNSSKEYTVVATKYGKGKEEVSYEPYRIKIFPNYMKLSIGKPAAVVNDYVTMATLRLAIQKANNGKYIIAKGDKKHCTLFEFSISKESECFELSKLENERERKLYYNIAKVVWHIKYGKYGELKSYSYSFEYDFFTQKWARTVLWNMSEYFCNKDEKLIPRLDGTWKKEYITGLSFPYMNYFNHVPNMNEWKDFLSIENIFPIYLKEIKKSC